MNPQIEQVQPDVFNKLASEPYFAAVSLFLIRQERFESEINEALSSAAFDARQAGKLPGATIEVLMPLVKTRLGNAPGPVVTLEQRLTVRENPTINLGSGGTGLTAEELCHAILQTLHQFQLDGVCQAFYPAAECVAGRVGGLRRDYAGDLPAERAGAHGDAAAAGGRPAADADVHGPGQRSVRDDLLYDGRVVSGAGQRGGGGLRGAFQRGERDGGALGGLRGGERGEFERAGDH
jgi:hypothetical protein